MATKPKSGRSPAGLLDFAAQAKSALFGGAKDTPAPRPMPNPMFNPKSLSPSELEQLSKQISGVTAAENVNILRDPAELAKVVAQFENLPQMQRSRELSEMDRELLLRRADRKASPDYLTPLKEFANMSYGTKFDIQPKEEPSILQDAAGYSAAQRRQAGGDIDSLAKIFQTGSMGKLTTTKGGEYTETYTAENEEMKKARARAAEVPSLWKIQERFLSDSKDIRENINAMYPLATRVLSPGATNVDFEAALTGMIRRTQVGVLTNDDRRRSTPSGNLGDVVDRAMQLVNMNPKAIVRDPTTGEIRSVRGLKFTPTDMAIIRDGIYGLYKLDAEVAKKSADNFIAGAPTYGLDPAEMKAVLYPFATPIPLNIQRPTIKPKQSLFDKDSQRRAQKALDEAKGAGKKPKRERMSFEDFSKLSPEEQKKQTGAK